jgi:VanZ family protein
MATALRRAYYFGPVLVWMGLIFYYSGKAGSNVNSFGTVKKVLDLLARGMYEQLSYRTLDDLNYILRKTLHISEYTVLTLLLLRAAAFGTYPMPLKRLFGAGIVSLLYSMSDELHQHFVPGRTSSPEDVLIDSCGILLVLSLALLARLHRHIDARLNSGADSAPNSP